MSEILLLLAALVSYSALADPGRHDEVVSPQRRPEAQAPELGDILRDLGAAQFPRRERAENKLRTLVRGNLAELRRSLKAHSDPEVRRRLSRVLAPYEPCQFPTWDSAYRAFLGGVGQSESVQAPARAFEKVLASLDIDGISSAASQSAREERLHASLDKAGIERHGSRIRVGGARYELFLDSKRSLLTLRVVEPARADFVALIRGECDVRAESVLLPNGRPLEEAREREGDLGKLELTWRRGESDFGFDFFRSLGDRGEGNLVDSFNEWAKASYSLPSIRVGGPGVLPRIKTRE